ncbi:MAG: M50 family metallopeptidase [Actinomycetota bacterium]|nr:M50 family metallopeptidase [Actinomycetota bacterium]
MAPEEPTNEPVSSPSHVPARERAADGPHDGTRRSTHPGATARTPEPEPQAKGTSWVRLAALVGGIAAIGIFASVSLLFIVLAIIVMIFLHELGHYLTAKSAGMKVTEFFIGFGPRIWSFHRGETEYGVKAIPAGAYVRIIGMHNLDEVDPADEARAYRQKPYWRRMSVAVAGSAMHFFLALASIWAVLVFYGGPNGSLRYDPEDWAIGRVTPGSAAESLGIQEGDDLVAVDGVSVATFDELAAAVQPRPNETVEVTWLRNGIEQSGEVELGSQFSEPGVETGLLGVSPTYEHVPFETVNPFTAVYRSFGEFGSIVGMTFEAFGDIFSPDGVSDFVGQVRDAGNDEPIERGSGGGASGNQNRPISIFGAAVLGADAVDAGGLASALLFMVSINIFVGIFNLVPLLPLDGGHVAIGTYERIRELFRRDGRRYFVDVAKLMPLTYLVVIAMVGLGVSTLYLDIVDPVQVP